MTSTLLGIYFYFILCDKALILLYTFAQSGTFIPPVLQHSFPQNPHAKTMVEKSRLFYCVDVLLKL